MPPRISFSREMIIDAAVQIVRKEGIEKVNARNVAGIIGGSTQPIYREFGSITELVDAVVEKLTPLALKYMVEAEDHESAFLSIGLGFLEFSRKEPGIFDLLFVKGKKKWLFTPENPFLGPLLEKMRRDPYLKDMSDRTLLGLFRDMFIYTHGLCMLKSIDIDRSDPVQERQLLHDAGGGLIAMAILKEKEPNFIEEVMRGMMK